MADLRPQHDEEVVAANHPTKDDVTNRAWNVEHDEDGTHKTSLAGTGLTGGAGTPFSVDGIVEVGASAELKIKIINIGNWDMDATVNIQVVHGLTRDDIRQISVVVRDDAAEDYYPLDYSDVARANLEGAFYINQTQVQLFRRVGGIFDHVDFDETPYNRGWITIWYVI